MGLGRSFRRGALGRVLVAVAVVLLSVPIAASTAEGGTAPGVTVTSPNQCLGPGAMLTFDSRFFASPAGGGQNFVTVLAGGTKSIGTLPIVPVASGPFVDFNVLGSLPLSSGTGGVFSWTLRQVFTSSSGAQSNIDHRLLRHGALDLYSQPGGEHDVSATTGGSLTLTGQVNRANEQIDVGFDVDVTQARSRSRTSSSRSATPVERRDQRHDSTRRRWRRQPRSSWSAKFRRPVLLVGRRPIRQRNGVPPDQIVRRAHHVLPCPNAALLFTPGALQLRLRERGPRSEASDRSTW
jgi:hypothetical protein